MTKQIINQQNLRQAFSNLIQETLKDTNDKPKHSFKKWDIIQVGKSKTTGIVIRTTKTDIIFVTFDKSGWIEAVTNFDQVQKIKLPKKTNENIILKEFLDKFNKQTFVLNKDFVTYVYDKKIVIFEGEIMIIDEQQSFIDQLLQNWKGLHHPTQLQARFIESENVFSVIRCFRLKVSDYLYIPLSYLSPFSWNQSLFNKLILLDKERLLDFITLPNITKKYGIDFYKGKGKSILLYGETGSGKTYTVEAISHKLRRPIIAVDGEIDNIGFALKNAFSIAERYNGIVFIDEAEMVISNRNSQFCDLNGIRTLLKYMEQFQGIIFFSTNCVNDIDESLNNRIDMRIEYKITSEIQKYLWRSMLPKKLDGKFDIQKYLKNDLNGRDIQKIILNACRKANKQQLKKVPVQFIENEIQYRLKEKVSLKDVDGKYDDIYFG